MKSRLVASAALSGLVLLGATGCSMISPQATTIDYSASDGVNVPSEGPLAVRNAFIVATEDGDTGNLVAAIVNDTDDDAVLTVELTGIDPFTVDVEAGETLSLGANTKPLRIDDLGVAPGATVSVYFQSGGAAGTAIEVPVLDGTLPYYADLVPSPSATPKPLPTVTPQETAAPAETPAEETPAEEGSEEAPAEG